MAIKLENHQLETLKNLKNGCVLCGGVGSGKSITSLAYYYLLNGGNLNSLLGKKYLRMADPPKNLYIITTARKRDTLEWEKELIRFLLSTNVDINSYSNTVVIDSWNNIKKYKEVKNSFFIFDEQRVIGSGVWVKSFLKITKFNEWILLSATPGDTWSDYIPLFIANGFFKNKTEFNDQHVIFSRFTNFPKIDRYYNTGKLIKLRKSILVNMDFKRPADSNHIDIYVNYDNDEYQTISKSRWNPYTNEPVKNAAELCYLYRRIVNSDKSRQIALLDIFSKHSKIIVFYNYNYELDILRGLDFGNNVKIAEWNGHKHEPIPNGNCWVYLVQYSAGNEGWNCIETDTIVFFSENYSYKVMVQAAGRIDRMNTPFKKLYYYHLKTKSNIDLAITRALKTKKKFNENQYIKNV